MGVYLLLEDLDSNIALTLGDFDMTGPGFAGPSLSSLISRFFVTDAIAEDLDLMLDLLCYFEK